MVKVDIHVLINRGMSCLNRGKDQRMKRGVFGGIERSRQSSQSIKHAQREAFMEDEDIRNILSVRSREFSEMVARELVRRGRSEKSVSPVVEKALTLVGLPIDAGDDEDEKRDDKGRLVAPLKTMLHYSKEEFNVFVDAIDANFDALKEDDTPKKEVMNDLSAFAEHGCGMIDTALFGRFLADPKIKKMTVSGSAQVANAFSVNPMAVEKDFFVALDDLTGQVGAGFMGDQDIGSNTLYQYSSLDLGQLAKNLGDDTLVPKVAGAFIRTFVKATPKAKQTSTAEHTLPCMVRIIARKEPRSFANAFDKPVYPGDHGLAIAAIERLSQHASALDKAYGNDDVLFDGFFVVGDECQIKMDGSKNCESLARLIKSIEDFIA